MLQNHFSNYFLSLDLPRKAPIEVHYMDDARHVFNVNFFGTLHLIQLVLPAIRASSGRIITMSSVCGFLSVRTLGIYSASKHALESLSDTLRRELVPFRVSVSIIESGLIKDEIPASALQENEKAYANKDKSDLSAYAELYSQAQFEKEMKILAEASDPIVVSTAIEDAIFARFPKTRYQVSTLGYFSVLIIRWMQWLLSDRVMDFIVNS